MVCQPLGSLEAELLQTVIRRFERQVFPCLANPH